MNIWIVTETIGVLSGTVVLLYGLYWRKQVRKVREDLEELKERIRKEIK